MKLLRSLGFNYYIYKYTNNVNRMKKHIYIIFALISLSASMVSCSEQPSEKESVTESQLNNFSEFHKENHFKSEMTKASFDTLHRWEFAWAVIDPVLVMIESTPFEYQRVKRLASGQKALYFFLQTDEQVKNGGFVQFYWNGLEGNVPPLKEGLSLIKDKEMLNLIKDADKYYRKNKDIFEKATDVESFNALYDECPEFKRMTERYMELREVSIDKFEKYAKKNSHQFVVYKK